jgi:hypothetical protein
MIYDSKPPSGKAVVPLPPLVIVAIVVLRAVRTNNDDDDKGKGGVGERMMVSIIIISCIQMKNPHAMWGIIGYDSIFISF